jgi:hypothetical protein
MMRTEEDRMTSFNPWRSLVRVIGFVAAAFLITGIPTSRVVDAGAATGTVGPLTVSATPISGLSDGSVVVVHADAPAGTVIYELKARWCTPQGLAPVRNTYDFGFQGKRCASVPVGGGEAESVAAYPEGSASGDVALRAGVGSVQWVNDLGYLGTLTCGPGSPCLLVVQAQITDATVFYNAVLCFGADCPAEPGTLAPPAAPAASVPPPAGAGTAVAGSTGADTPSAPTSAPAGASNKPSARVETKNGGIDPSSRSTSKPASIATRDLGSQPASATMTVDTSLLSPRERVFAAAVLGALGCARIVSVSSRVRRRNLAGVV